MIGKTKRLNFSSLFFFILFSLIINSFIFSNLFIVSIFLTFFLFSLLITKHGLKIIKQLNLLQNIRNQGPSIHLTKKNTPTLGGIFIILVFIFQSLDIEIKGLI